MRVDGAPAPAQWIDAAAARFEALFRSTGASFFEATTALSFRYFADQDVDLAIVEVGLGGRFDATNVIDPDLSIITSISLEHAEILGESIALIAAEKAGIVKPGTPVLTAVRDDEALSAIRRSARDQEARLHLVQEDVKIEQRQVDVDSGSSLVTFSTPGGTCTDVNLGLAGEHQAINAALAIRATQLAPVCTNIGPEAVSTGLRDVVRLSGIRGRCERIVEHPSIFVDVAHNDEAMMRSVDTWLAGAAMPTHVYLGVMKDKRIEAFARYLSAHELPVTTLHLKGERALDGRELAARLRAWDVAVKQEAVPVFDALQHALQDMDGDASCLFLGSHIVVADALAWQGTVGSSG
jgi:dihydrofolate synthase/folylpolyglutamate synthase